MPGMGELIVILVIVLIVFGAGKIPQIGEALGRGIRNFKRSSSGSDETEVGPKAKEIEAKETAKEIEAKAEKKEPAASASEKAKES